MSFSELEFMQNYSYHVRNISMPNIEQRNMDRFFTNKMNLNDWIKGANELQLSLTDTVIVHSVKGMPPEIFSLSGPELISKLKSRRSQLQAFAKKYYLFLAKGVDIPGSKKRDYFEIKRRNTGETEVKVFSVNKRRLKSDTPFYRRVFNPFETKEIRLYGIDGEDSYSIYSKSRSIKVRIIGGPDKDSIVQYVNKP